jgi:hypothetical protein
MRLPSWSQSSSPFFQLAAVFSASCSGVRPWRLASSESIQGRKSAGASEGKVRARLARSPLGSMASAGMPSMAASSSSPMQSPVLPLPVIPTQTPWVVRSFES